MTKENEAELEAKAQAEAEAKAKADAKAKDAEDDDSEKESDDSQKKATDPKTDYEAELKVELEKEKEAREKAEKAAADNAFKLREAKRKKEEENNEEEEEEKPLTPSQLTAILAQERQATQKMVQETRIGEIAGKWATSETEKNLFIEIHKNRTFPPHLSLEEQFEEVVAIANRKKLIGERNEALRALKGKDGTNNNPAGTHHDAPKGVEPQLNPKDKKVFTQLGYSYNATTRRYEKKLKNGNLHYIDPKTKKLVIVSNSK